MLDHPLLPDTVITEKIEKETTSKCILNKKYCEMGNQWPCIFLQLFLFVWAITYIVRSRSWAKRYCTTEKQYMTLRISNKHFLCRMEIKIYGNYYHFWMVYLWKAINWMLSWKNECKIYIFSFGHSDCVCVDAEKWWKKPCLHHYLLYVKSQICIGIAKIEKLKTWPLSEFIMFLEWQILTLESRFVILRPANLFF